MSAYEGWHVALRPALRWFALAIAGLVALVVAAGLFYRARYADQTRAEPRPARAPQLETIDTAPTDADQVPPPAPPRAIGRAKAQIVARGAGLWR